MKKPIVSMLLVAGLIISLIPVFLSAARAQNQLFRTVWENPYTLTTYNLDNRVNSTFYTIPKVIWNGSQYVEYLLNVSDMSAGIGSAYIKVGPEHTALCDPNKKEVRINSEAWEVEYYSSLKSIWETERPISERVHSLVNSSGIYFERTTTLASGSTFDEWYWLRIGSTLKISIIFHPVKSGEYRLVWLLGGVSGTEARWLTNAENVTGQVVDDKACSHVQFIGENDSKCLVDWSDAVFFNATAQKPETWFQGLMMERDVVRNGSQARVLFGDFSLNSGRSFILDPSIMTLCLNKAESGLIEKRGAAYPPDSLTYIDQTSSTWGVGQFAISGPYYFRRRVYLSFDTSAIPATAYNMSATLKLATSLDASTVDFTMQVMGGNQPVYIGNLTVLDGTQPIYGDALSSSSWGTGAAMVATWDTANYPGDGVYINLTIPSNQINKIGRTQFELKSSRDGTNAPQVNQWEVVYFYSEEYEPELEVSYNLDTITLGQPELQETWFYRNAGTSKAALVLYGAFIYNSTVILIQSIELVKNSFGKMQFIDALVENGFSVFTPKNSSNVPWPGYSYYENGSTWIQDLTMWLMYNQTYTQVYLFGMSGGAMVVGNEIQKDYAYRFSAAVMTSAPVNHAGYQSGQIFHTALTASEAKVATFFPENVNDSYYDQTQLYYNNEVVDKKWVNWTGGHGDLFLPNSTALDSSGDNSSVAVISWFDAAHPPSTPFTPTGAQTCNNYTSYSYSSGTVDPDGEYLSYVFDWGDGTNTTVGPFLSGVNVTRSHQWNTLGSYNVTVCAEDSSSAWSCWSQPLTVNVTYGDDGYACDAGNDFNSAAVYNPYYDIGSLRLSYSSDDSDYYKFYVFSGNTIAINVTPPLNASFFLELYSPTNPNSTYDDSYNYNSSQYISDTVQESGWWRANIGTVFMDSGIYTFSISVTGGGGCPYVYSWTGSAYAKDNNILPASETGNGTDVKDYYKLEEEPAPIFSLGQTSVYSLQIREFESEQDHIDQVTLTAVDHSPGTSTAVTPEGQILTYTNPAAPASCIDSHGASQLSRVAAMDGNVSDSSTYFQGDKDDWLVLNFGEVSGSTADLILRDDMFCDKVCLEVQVQDPYGVWQTIETLHPRAFWSMEAVNMTAYLPSTGDFLVRLLFTATHRIDFVGLDTSTQTQVTVNSAPSFLAVHSSMGLVTAKLSLDDENCVELVNGQQLTLFFVLPKNAQDTTRDFIFYTNGYYYIIT